MSYYNQTTHQFPSLPPANGGPVPAADTAYGVMPYAPAVAPVPVVPPRRGAGFWVGISVAVSTGVILALLSGFFIGRGTRLSNTEAQSKITQQAQADQIAEQQALAAQKAADQRVQDRAVARAQNVGEQQGLQQGQIQGQQQGFQQGQAQGFQQGQASGQAQGYQQGQQDGFNQGQSSGFNQGYSLGVCAAQSLIC